MRIPNQPNVERSEDPTSWASRLNKFFLQVVSAFQSIKSADEYVDLQLAGTAERFPIRRDASPADAVLLAKASDVERPFDSVVVTGMHWGQEGSVIYAQLAGLTAGRLYDLRFLIRRKL